jgi:hypothetical protein
MRHVRLVGCAMALVLLSLWVLAVFRYDPWRRNRVRAAMSPGLPWARAVVAAEKSAFPIGDKFVAICETRGRAHVVLERQSATSFGIRDDQALGQAAASGVLPRGSAKFASHDSWAAAVRSLGERVRCDKVTVLWPPTDVIVVRLDAAGLVVATTTSAGE